jgi:hypothetical protein
LAPALDGESPGEGRSAAPARPDLVSTLKGQFGSVKETKQKPKVKGDYEKFIEGMSDISGARPAEVTITYCLILDSRIDPMVIPGKNI